jgi:hypothetical protein
VYRCSDRSGSSFRSGSRRRNLRRRVTAFAAKACLASLIASSAALAQQASTTQTSQSDHSAAAAKQQPPAETAQTPESPVREDERENQIVAESARLLKLARELKAEADKTTIDTLSLSIIRKADAVGKLARDVKAKIKDGQQQKTGAKH